MRRDHTFKQRLFNSSLLMVLSSFFLFSCVTTKNITYFRDVPDTTRYKVVDETAYQTPVIQPDDILQVSIQTLDPGATALLNQRSTTSWQVAGAPASGNNPGSTEVSGYLVDKDGYVLLPLIGKVMAKGKTTDQIRDEIRVKASEYYKDPVINVRFANFKITVLGEVARPATYIMPNEKVTLLDALGMAGDLTIYGKRENVLLIREKNGKKELVRFDMNNSQLFTSPYYYLQQGDVIYVEPNRARIVSTDAARMRNITILTTVMSLITILIVRVF